MSAATEVLSGRRLRDGWTAAHAAVDGAPRWARVAAFVVTLVVLPSSLWRVATFALHLPLVHGSVEAPSGIPGIPLEVHVVSLSIASEVLAFAAVGLVARWGEVFPWWVPGLRGRRVPTLFAVVPAGLASVFLTLLWTWTAITFALGLRIDLKPPARALPLNVDDWQGVVAVVAYAPLLLWGPLLGGLTVAYWRRRRGRRTTGSGRSGRT